MTLGLPRVYRVRNGDVRHFCVTCGSLLFAERRATPGSVAIPIATLDDPQWLIPEKYVLGPFP
jgi:hypothetical protein